jgi:hypothetical protein
VTCHASVPANIGRFWGQGTFSHSPLPTACATCHASDQTFLNVKSITTKQMNHTVSGLPDCVTCHATAASASGFTAWVAESVVNGSTVALATLGIFHNGYGSTPTSCTTCHSNERPVGAVGSPVAFDHANGGSGDCVTCHTTNIGRTWSGGAFNHSGATSCSSCHASERPTGLKGAVGLTGNIMPTGGLFNHASNGGTGDCITCHTSVAANIGVQWTGGTFPHSPLPTSCTGCHTSAQVPSGTVGSVGFNHATAPGGTGDCVNCHASVAANVGKIWSQATYAHSSATVSCAGCHTSDPLYTAKASVIFNQMNHSMTGLPDCATCHKSAALAGGFTNWTAEAVVNTSTIALASLGVAHTGFTATPATCVTCHANERPTGAVGSPVAFDHSSSGGTGDCKGCHTANIGLKWAGGNFSHTGITTCASCHASETKAPATLPNTADGFNHAATYGTECAACHMNVAANIGVRWSGGFFGHNGNKASTFTQGCTPCHDTKKHHAGSVCTSCHSTGSGMVWPTATAPGAWGQP